MDRRRDIFLAFPKKADGFAKTSRRARKSGTKTATQIGISKSGSITFADGNLYCFENTREVRLLQATPKGYKQQGEFRPPQAQGRHTWTHPVVANGKLYLRDQRMIFCYDLRRPGGRLHSLFEGDAKPTGLPQVISGSQKIANL